MDGPWFRRYAGFSYRPVCWQGWVVTAAMLVVVVPFGRLFVHLSDDHPVLSWLCAGVGAAFSAAYYALVVVLAEGHASIGDAIAREKALKAWRREWKVALAEASNPGWEDLFRGCRTYRLRSQLSLG